MPDRSTFSYEQTMLLLGALLADTDAGLEESAINAFRSVEVLGDPKSFDPGTYLRNEVSDALEHLK